MNETNYTKLSALVGQSFTLLKVDRVRYKMWDNGSKKMVAQDSYFDGSKKVYETDTDKGRLDLSAGQLGQLHAAVSKDGISDLNGQTFEVGSNGKTGMEIRYYFKPVGKTSTEKHYNVSSGDVILEDLPETINVDEIPF